MIYQPSVLLKSRLPPPGEKVVRPAFDKDEGCSFGSFCVWDGTTPNASMFEKRGSFSKCACAHPLIVVFFPSCRPQPNKVLPFDCFPAACVAKSVMVTAWDERLNDAQNLHPGQFVCAANASISTKRVAIPIANVHIPKRCA